jgi:hypothetical protein
MSKLDRIYWYERSVSSPGHHQGYSLGAVLFYTIWTWFADKLRSDCSGAWIGLVKRAGVLFKKDGQLLSYDKALGTKRPRAQTVWNACKKWGRVAEQPDQIPEAPGSGLFMGFHKSRYTGLIKHIWNRHPGHEDKYLAEHYGDHSPVTFESGDGFGHGCIFHTDLWRAQHARGYKVVYGWLPCDAGDLTPASGTSSPPDWPLPIARNCSDGLLVRQLKGIMNWVIPGCSLSTADTVNGRSLGPITEGHIKRSQQEAGQPATGIVDNALMAYWGSKLRGLVG